jgi:hypothetical protein
MSQSFTVAVIEHKAFGFLITLMLPGEPARRFTREEALIVSRALGALACGASAEREIYMSPIASDYDFDVRVGADGVVVTIEGGGAALNWDEARALARELELFGGAATFSAANAI